MAISVTAIAAAASTADARTRAVHKRYAAVAFDYFVLFNPDSVVAAVDRIAPGKGQEFTNLWRTRQFGPLWLRSITDRYVDFLAITDDALLYTANAMHVQLTAAQRQQLVDAYLRLAPWPDTADALRRLRAAGVRVITIANFSPAMLRANADNAGLTPLFDALVSTDTNHTYKPDPRAYQLGVDHQAKSAISSLPPSAGGMQPGRRRSVPHRLGQPVQSAARGTRPAAGANRG